MNELDKQLYEIVHLGDIEAVKKLISLGANLNCQVEEEDGETIFTRAILTEIIAFRKPSLMK